MIFPMRCNTSVSSTASPSVYRPVRLAKCPVIPAEHPVHRSPGAPLVRVGNPVSGVKRNPIHLPNLHRYVNPVYLIQKRCTRDLCVKRMSKETNWTRVPDNMSSYEIFMRYKDLWEPFLRGESLISPSILSRILLPFHPIYLYRSMFFFWWNVYTCMNKKIYCEIPFRLLFVENTSFYGISHSTENTILRNWNLNRKRLCMCVII
jgi:hypothetical protein